MFRKSAVYIHVCEIKIHFYVVHGLESLHNISLMASFDV